MSTPQRRTGARIDSSLVRTACADDAAALSCCLADAFQDDPSFGWAIPDPDDRARHLPTFFRIVSDALVGNGECEHVSFGAERSGTIAAALWVPPLQAPLPESQIGRLLSVFESIGPAAAGRFLALTGLMDARHPTEQHFYLWFLGVSPTFQRQGWGGRLLRSKLDWCDEHSLDAYLEATSERNRQLYERNGFRVTAELTVDGSPTIWAMWRQPQAAAKAGDRSTWTR